MVKIAWKLLKDYWQLAALLLVVLAAAGCRGFDQWLASRLVLGIGVGLLTLPLLNDLWNDVRNGHYGFDFLALVAIYDALCLRQFWLAAAVMAVAYTSKRLERYAGWQLRREVARSSRSSTDTVHIIRGRKTVDVRALTIQAGDKLLINANEIVPVEAVMLEHSSQFDESALTHDKTPVSKVPGEHLSSGSRNQGPAVIVRALSSVADSQHRQVIKIMGSAGAQRAPFARQAERFGWFFTFLALAIGGGAWFAYHQASRFLEVIVVAAPGPLLLAPAVAILAGIHRASLLGIIVRTGSGFERLATARTFAFAKTSVIGSAAPAIDNVTVIQPYSRPQLLGLVASVLVAADQPLAQAVLAAAGPTATLSKVKHLQVMPDQVLRASLKGYHLVIGQAEQLAAAGVAIEPAADTKRSSLYIAINDQLAASLSFKDEPVAAAKPALKALQRLGTTATYLFGSDTESALQRLAKKVGIEQVLAGTTPGARLQALEKLPDRPVVVVGDGQRDAPLLTTADVGIALGAQGSALAGEGADIIVLANDLQRVAELRALSRRSFDSARLSIAGGTLLSLGLMLGFAIGHVSPWIGVSLPLFISLLAIAEASQAGKPQA